MAYDPQDLPLVVQGANALKINGLFNNPKNNKRKKSLEQESLMPLAKKTPKKGKVVEEEDSAKSVFEMVDVTAIKREAFKVWYDRSSYSPRV